MSKVIILGDVHFGVRGDSVEFFNYFLKFVDDVFFPFIKNNKIKNVVMVGDVFDRRKFVNFNILNEAKVNFFDKLSALCENVYIILGNHDVYYKQTLRVNSPVLLLDSYPNFHVIDSFSEVNFDGVWVDMVPWVCDENRADSVAGMASSESSICIGHFELSGFQMDKGNYFKGDGIDKDIFLKYRTVLSGHFHHKNDDGHIFYVGSPYEMTWADYGNKKGFHVFDLKTKKLDFIENPYKIFNKVIYDDVSQDSEYWKNYDYTTFKDSYVKVLVANKKEPYLFDVVLDNLYKSEAYDIGIIENVDIQEVEGEDIETEDTYSILCKYIDLQKFDVEPSRLKIYMKDVYLEALNSQKFD